MAIHHEQSQILTKWYQKVPETDSTMHHNVEVEPNPVTGEDHHHVLGRLLVQTMTEQAWWIDRNPIIHKER